MSDIAICLTFTTQAEEAVRYYLSIFEGGKILSTIPGPGGSVISLTFELFGKKLIALNGPPMDFGSGGFSMFVTCDTQEEIDRYWSKLTEGGKEIQCGWCVDKFGVTWQIVPKDMMAFLTDKDAEKAGRAMQAMMKMQKLDINVLRAAFEGR